MDILISPPPPCPQYLFTPLVLPTLLFPCWDYSIDPVMRWSRQTSWCHSSPLQTLPLCSPQKPSWGAPRRPSPTPQLLHQFWHETDAVICLSSGTTCRRLWFCRSWDYEAAIVYWIRALTFLITPSIRLQEHEETLVTSIQWASGCYFRCGIISNMPKKQQSLEWYLVTITQPNHCLLL